MPLCTLHLLSLHRTTPDPLLPFLSTLKSTNISPLVVSRVIRWIILPTHISTAHLLARNIVWDVLLILPGTAALPVELGPLVKEKWSVSAGVPSRLLDDFAAKNARLLKPEGGTSRDAGHKGDREQQKQTVPSSQNLELSAELNEWIDTFMKNGGKEATGAVSMFNLLSFNPGLKSEYLKYGAAFASSIGARHGGNAKIVGSVTHTNGIARSPATATAAGVDARGNVGGAEAWDEIALAHYPSIEHFREMLVDGEYQDVNRRHRVPSLRDTAILMTSEVGIWEMMKGGGARL